MDPQFREVFNTVEKLGDSLPGGIPSRKEGKKKRAMREK